MADKKRYTPSVALTPEEKKYLEKKAKKVGISYTRYIREVALGELPQGDVAGTQYELIKELGKLRSELTAIGNNLNQMARIANQTGAINGERIAKIEGHAYELKMRILDQLT
jgi:hypothetical protein